MRTNRIVSVCLLLAVLLPVGCSRSYDILLVADPVYEDLVLSSGVTEELQEALSDHSRTLKVLIYDSQDRTADVQQIAEGHTPELLWLSPALSKEFLEGTDPLFASIVEQWKDEGVRVLLMVSSLMYEQLPLSARDVADHYLIEALHTGWLQADELLDDRFSDHSRIGIMVRDQDDVDQLFTKLCADGANHPQIAVLDEYPISTAAIRQAVASFADTQVQTLCILLGADTLKVLPLIANNDMIAIIEQGRYLPLSGSAISASIEYDYRQVADQLVALLGQEEDAAPEELFLYGIYTQK